MATNTSESQHFNVLTSLSSRISGFDEFPQVLLETSSVLESIIKVDKLILAISRNESEFDIFEYESGRHKRKTWTSQGTALRASMDDRAPVIEPILGKYSQFFDMRELHSEGYGSCAVFPISPKEHLGAVAFVFRKNDSFDDKQALLGAVAGLLGPTIKSVLLSRSLNETNSLGNTVFENSSDAVIVVNPLDDGIHSVNQKASDFFDLPSESLLKKNIHDLFPDPEELKKRFSKVKGG
ncbi:MAG: PAS domain-containing protein, partial [Candidatus Micrarchaeota archaeon]